MERGCVQVYTGNGKGKTTAMFGLALRACGAGLKVYIGQFAKFGDYCEIKAIKKFLPDIVVEQYGEGYELHGEISRSDIISAKTGLKKAVGVMRSGKYDIIMLDEINIAIFLGFINIKDVLKMIKTKPAGVELVLTGRYAKDEIIAAADLVSEIVEVKHYFNCADNLRAREGIEK
jgi:cob(I)alamin adenosyltransferase